MTELTQEQATTLLLAATKGPNQAAELMAESAVQAIEDQMKCKMPPTVRPFILNVITNVGIQMAMLIKAAYDVSGAKPVFGGDED